MWPILISALALLISALGLLVNYRNNKRTNTRLDALSEPRIDITKHDFTTFAESTTAPLGDNFYPGYDPLILAQLADDTGNLKKRFRIVSELLFWDEGTGRRLSGTLPIQSTKEFKAEVKRASIQKPVLAKHLRVVFTFTNLGQLPAENIIITSKTSIAKDLLDTRHTQLKSVLNPTRDYILALDLYQPFTEPTPAEMKFEILINYESAGKKRPTIPKRFVFTPNTAQWLEINDDPEIVKTS